jgi:hypothetical protein
VGTVVVVVLGAALVAMGVAMLVFARRPGERVSPALALASLRTALFGGVFIAAPFNTALGAVLFVGSFTAGIASLVASKRARRAVQAASN